MTTRAARRAWLIITAMSVGLAVLSGLAWAQKPPTDVLGWQNTRWGMTEPEVRKTLEAQRFRLVPQTPSESRHSGASAPFRTHLKIAPCDYKVVFVFSDVTRRLSYLYLAPSSTDKAGQILWESARECHAGLLRLLTDKYGTPTSLPTASDPNHAWVFTSTRIKLYEVPERKVMNDATLSLVYEPTAAPPKQDDKQKL
jgi:hypothetical protein